MPETRGCGTGHNPGMDAVRHDVRIRLSGRMVAQGAG